MTPTLTEEQALLEAVRHGHDTQALAIREASAMLAMAGRFTPHEDLHWAWKALCCNGSVVRQGRRWRCA